MKTKITWTRVLFIAGITAMLIGMLDPLEGSAVVAAGILMIVVATFATHDRHRKIFALTCAMILIGIGFLFYLSSLGGFGGHSGLSWWYGLLVLPYPIGWIITIVVLIIRIYSHGPLNTLYTPMEKGEHPEPGRA